MVEVVIRPDQLELMPDRFGSAVVISRRFRGADTLLVVQFPSGLILHSYQPSSVMLLPKEQVKVVARPTPVVAFPAEVPQP